MTSLMIAVLSMLVAVAVAIYVLVNSGQLSLPMSPATRILLVMLPIIALANAYFSPVLHRIWQRGDGSADGGVLTPFALQIAQGILTVVLATISFQAVLPGRGLDCNLHETWQQLWRNADGRSIERIQDAFDCCGFRSIKDMSWPRQGVDTSLCTSLYHRSTPCVGPWTGAMQKNAGLDFGVATAVGLFQLIWLMIYRLRGSNQGTPGRGYHRLPQTARGLAEDRLLEDDATAEPSPSEGEIRGHITHQNYGSSGNGAGIRVEPSGLGDENEWDDPRRN